MWLLRKRAEAVRDYLIASGISGSLITATGVGDTKPSCEDWDPVAKKQIFPCAQTERNVTLVATGIVVCGG